MEEAIRRQVSELTKLTDFTVERPKQPEHGDYATNVALMLAKQKGENPRQVAEKLAKELSSKDYTTVEVAGPGFINFRIAPSAWQRQLAAILKQGENFGRTKGQGRKIQIEFISANPTGPLTLANGRGGYAGDVLANVLTRAGHQVEREYYINDAGNQVRTLGEALAKPGFKAGDPYYSQYAAALRKKLDTKQPSEEVGAQAAGLIVKDIRRTVQKMGINYDVWFSEQQQLHDQGAVDKALDDLRLAGAAYEKEGAIWLKSTAGGDDKDRVLRKSDGSYTYVAADIAYHRNKFVKRGFDRVINIWGADHAGDVARLQYGVGVIRRLDKFKGELAIILTQFVRLVRDGREVKMSKRAGDYVALDDLLDQIPPDVARFFFVQRSFDTHMDFDLGLAKEQSQKNPVYYLKYAFARISGILRNAGQQEQADFTKLAEPTELVLIKELAEFPKVIREIAADYQVHRLPYYALRVADAFHRFYEECRVITDDAALTAARLQLVDGTRQVLRNIGDTLGIEMPERM